MMRWLFTLSLLTAVLLSACAVSSRETAGLPTVPLASPSPTTAASPTAASISTLSPTSAPSPTLTAAPEIPLPAAAAAYLEDAHVVVYDPLDSAEKWNFSGGKIKVDGSLKASSNRWETGNWAEIGYANTYPKGWAVLVNIKFYRDTYFFAGLGARRDHLNHSMIMNISSDGVFKAMGDPIKPPSDKVPGSYPLRADTWHTLLLGVSTDGIMRAMIINPDQPEQYYLWEQAHPEWYGESWALQLIDGWGKLILDDFYAVQFAGFKQ